MIEFDVFDRSAFVFSVGVFGLACTAPQRDAAAPAAEAKAASRATSIPTADAAKRATSTPATASVPPSSSASSTHATDAAAPSSPTGRPCGALGCLAFTDAKAAFAYAIRGTPRVLAVGESHAQKAGPEIASATRRFREQLLPLVPKVYENLVLETLVPDKRCDERDEAAVARRSQEITKPQAAQNQNEFLALAYAARERGVVPQPLIPTCDELKSVQRAGDADIDAILRLVANITAREVTLLLARKPQQSVLVYGGLVHNDAVPRPGREAWSFGPQLTAQSVGGYLELDLIVPEFMRAGEPWQSLSFYAHYDAGELGREAVLFRPNENSYVLIFPRSAP